LKRRLLYLALTVVVVLLLVESLARIILGSDYYLSEENISAQEAHLRENNRKLGVAMLERHPDETVSFQLKPMSRVVYHHPETGEDQYYTINRHGLRGPDIQEIKPPKTRRIAILGDSFVFGVGADDARTVPRILEQALNSATAAQERYEVINSGVPGYHAGQMKELLLRKTLAFDPDVVVLMVSINDMISDYLYFDPLFKMLYTDFLPVPYSWKPVLWRLSVTYRYIVELSKDRIEADRRAGMFAEKDMAFFQRSVQAIRDEVLSRKIGFHVIVLPMLEDFKNYPFERRSRDLQDLLGDLAFTDLFPLMKDQDVTKLWFTTYDHHLNAKANEIVAGLIHEELVQRKLVPPGEGTQVRK
jgi:lysophospholipase L1-like esterase